MTVHLVVDDDTLAGVSDEQSVHWRATSPVVISTLDGQTSKAGYSKIIAASGGFDAEAHAEFAGLSVTVKDRWREGDGSVTVTRDVRASRGENDAAVGIRVEFNIELPAVGSARFFIPGMMYSPAQWERGGDFSYSDHRLAYPVTSHWMEDSGRATWLARSSVAAHDNAPVRSRGDSRFLQATDIGSVGFRTEGSDREAGRPALTASWPYREGDASAMLNSDGSPAEAYAPVPAAGFNATVTYRIGSFTAPTYVDMVATVFGEAFAIAQPTASTTSVLLADSINLRLDSAEKTYFVNESGFAAFVVNFDPERGYDSEAKAFGASFAEHHMSESRDIIEYGFTGRQLNLALLLAERDPQYWAERGAAVVDSFVNRMSTPSGWVFTLWHAGSDEPLHACGDPRGPVMHYLGESDLAGTYTRMMAEAGNDLLANIELHNRLGRDVERWRQAAVRLGDFFLRTQEADGSWFRAYAPDGRPIVDSTWFGSRYGSGKSATGTVVPFLTSLARLTGNARLNDSARRAADFVLSTHVARAEYRGGTLDNPNLVDKEAAFIAMRALLAVAGTDSGDRSRYEDGARQAAEIAITWHSIWEVPNVPETPLARADVRSVGWGGINSVWGVGVTDIYSLFFIADLHRLGVLLGNDRFVRMAELIAASSLELLAVPGALHGFTDSGMQPEGISFCSQGADDGLIVKGDTWGGLGWPYTAGSFGLGQYLKAVKNEPSESV